VSSHTVAGRPGKRVVTTINAVIALAVIVLVAAVALVVRPPAPPGIAEFAPQASKPITKAPPGQAGRFGSGAGHCATGAICVGVKSGKPRQQSATVAAPTGVPSALQCFTWPDGAVTQTFDPQSPPCIATWPGASQGNGGATTTGVTGTTIRIATPNPGLPNALQADQAIVNFLNTHFELYGRQIKLQVFTPAQGAGGTATPDPAKQEADAQTVTSELKSFAAASYADITWSSGESFTHTLASKHVLSVNAMSSYLTTATLAAHAPYEWNFRSAFDQIELDIAAVYCRGLKGQLAGHGGTDVANKTRKLAILIPQFQNGIPSPSPQKLTDALAACGVTPVVTSFQDEGKVAASSSDDEVMLNLRSGQVTTVLPLVADQDDVVDLMNAAQSDQYSPEWLLPGLQNDSNGGGYAAFAAAQSAHAFGIAAPNKPVAPSNEPWYESATQADPSVAKLSLNDGSVTGGTYVQPFYESMLLLASGIQESGPKLTATSFQSGLQQTTFPDPYAGAPPLYQSREGFGSGHVMLSGFALKWFSESAPDYWDGNQPPGDWCFLGKGSRYTTSTLPAGDPGFFSDAGDCG
jgi:hypothetical protein